MSFRLLQVTPYGWLLLMEEFGTGAFCVMGWGATAPVGWYAAQVACPGRVDAKAEGKGSAGKDAEKKK